MKKNKKPAAITQFENTDNFYLSNFYEREIWWGGKLWPTSEHLFQALKTENPEDQETIRKLPGPGYAKSLGQLVNMIPTWKVKRKQIMLNILRLKFGQHIDLAKRLINTKDCRIVEGNWWHDNIWGDCVCGKCKSIEGQNLLGELLMQVREELQNEGL